METYGLERLGFSDLLHVHRNLPPAKLVQMALERGEGELAANGALKVLTPGPSGRSPKGKYVFIDEARKGEIWWGANNPEPPSPEVFDTLWNKALEYTKGKDLFIFDAFAGANKNYRLGVRTISTKAWHSLFAQTLFVRPKPEELANHEAGFTVLDVCEMPLNGKDYGLKTDVFIGMDFVQNRVLIIGSHYGGEIKKSIFTAMNYLLPKRDVLSMHCSANVGADGDAALFFGLSGTGKTTLSADPNRRLIGDDEHGWCDEGIFNFEGGCYAKCINLSAEDEPQIYNAIHFGSILENVVLDSALEPHYDDGSLTENTRATYPVEFIPNCLTDGVGGHPKNIFFLAADAFGVLPPISRLTPQNAAYHFMSGYTAKLAGTEAGVTEPQATFSACFGAPFMPHFPGVYAKLLCDRIEKHGAHVWLVNTGWSGGGFGVGKRMAIKITRALLTAALSGELLKVPTVHDDLLNLDIPSQCPGVPSEVLIPRNAWADKAAYDQAARKLAGLFVENFKQFHATTRPEILAAGPKM